MQHPLSGLDSRVFFEYHRICSETEKPQLFYGNQVMK